MSSEQNIFYLPEPMSASEVRLVHTSTPNISAP